MYFADKTQAFLFQKVSIYLFITEKMCAMSENLIIMNKKKYSRMFDFILFLKIFLYYIVPKIKRNFEFIPNALY